MKVVRTPHRRSLKYVSASNLFPPAFNGVSFLWGKAAAERVLSHVSGHHELQQIIREFRNCEVRNCELWNCEFRNYKFQIPQFLNS